MGQVNGKEKEWRCWNERWIFKVWPQDLENMEKEIKEPKERLFGYLLENFQTWLSLERLLCNQDSIILTPPHESENNPIGSDSQFNYFSIQHS
jgi:hypothetical protein